VTVIEAAADGPVAALVRGALASAPCKGRKLVVYVGASWCKPCQRFHEALASGRLDAQLSDVAFLAFDYDRDRERLGADGYVSRVLPLLALPAPDGAPSGRQIAGGAPGEGAVDSMVRSLRAMLEGSIELGPPSAVRP
jgi:hypothetical protein